MFKGIFGKKRSDQRLDVSRSNDQTPPKQETSELIRVFDEFGRELMVPKEEWRTKVLPKSVQDAWTDPDRLYGVIANALNDGFFSDILLATQRLTELEPRSPRSACAYGIALMKVGRADQAERVLGSYTDAYGEDGSVLTNLAKTQAERGDNALADETLWRALRADPNQDNGLGWYWALAREKDSAGNGVDALRRLAELPGSWRAQLWLARMALQAGSTSKALEFYRQALDNMPRPAPADAVMQISGDLGNAGRLSELLSLCGPIYDADAHGLMAGNNLIKASIDTGNLDQADEILKKLYRLQRPDWLQTLSFWDTELAKARISSAQDAPPLEMTLLTIEGPVWAGSASPANQLFSDHLDGPTVCLLGASAEGVSNAEKPTRQVSDGPGRASRGIPLYFAEQLTLRSNTRTQTLIPWIVNGGGFVLSGLPWDDETAAGYARQVSEQCDWVVVCHLRCKDTPWLIDVKLIRTSDHLCIEKTTAEFNPINGVEIADLSATLLSWIAQHAGSKIEISQTLYSSPPASEIPDYILRLEQLLALRSATMDGVNNFMHGVREVIQGCIELCLRMPDSVSARIILAQSIAYLGKIDPSILKEMAPRLQKLQQEKPLVTDAEKLVSASIENALSSFGCA